MKNILVSLFKTEQFVLKWKCIRLHHPKNLVNLLKVLSMAFLLDIDLFYENAKKGGGEFRHIYSTAYPMPPDRDDQGMIGAKIEPKKMMFLKRNTPCDRILSCVICKTLLDNHETIPATV